VVRSAFRLPDGFDTGRSFLTTRLNQLCPSRSWLSRSASASEQIESKPRRPSPRTWTQVCLPATGWFRHGPLVPHDPAQPALPFPKPV